MKKIILITFICLSIAACKKKEETPTPLVTAPVKHCTAKVNGVAFSANYYASSGSSHKWYDITGSLGYTPPETSIRFTGKTALGIHTLGLYPNDYIGIYTINNVSYYSISGTINITAIDTSNTSNPLPKKISALFNFNTDTLSGVSYQITDGDINYVE
jgi:hypothetical protein